MPIPAEQDLKPATAERRKCVRQRVHTPAYANLNAGSGGADLSEILDISEDGVSIQTSFSPEVNQSIDLYLDLSETKARISARGQVVRCEGSGRAAIRFAEMPEASRQQVKEWLFLNAMMAGVNHAAALSPQPEPEESQPSPEEPMRAAFDGANASVEEFEFPAAPDYTSILSGLEAVRKEVDAIGPDLDAALQLIAERAQAFTRAGGAAIALSQGDVMICVATSGPDAPGLGARLQIGSGFSGECVQTGKLMRCDDSETDPHVDREGCRALGIRAMIASPIRAGDAVIGLLEVFSSQSNAFDESAGSVLKRLADIILGAVSRAARTAANRAQPSDESVLETVASERPSWAQSHRVILIAALAGLAILVFWLVASGAKGGPRKADQPLSQPKPQASASSSPVTAADATDLAGLRKLAEQGNPAAQFAMGAHYATGEDVKQDYTEAIRWFSMAAEQGHVVSQATLGAYYWAGRGVPQDLSKAYFWSVLAQAGGDQASKYRVAVLTSRMPRAQVLAAEQQANDWIKRHQSGSESAASKQP